MTPQMPKARDLNTVQSSNSYKGKPRWAHRCGNKILWDLPLSGIKPLYKCHLKETSGGHLHSSRLATSSLAALDAPSCCIVSRRLDSLQGCRLHQAAGPLVPRVFPLLGSDSHRLSAWTGSGLLLHAWKRYCRQRYSHHSNSSSCCGVGWLVFFFFSVRLWAFS